jgi:hypothetical protein
MVAVNLHIPEVSTSFTSLLLQLGIIGDNKDTVAATQSGSEEENGCGFA